MTELQKEFEANGYTSWINADLYPDGKIYTQEYTQWLERQVLALRQPPVIGRFSSLEECENEAISFTKDKLKVVGGLLSEDYKIGYKEGVEHYLASKNDL